MNKKKLTGWSAALAAIVAAIVSLRSPHPKPVPVPVPTHPQHTMAVVVSDQDGHPLAGAAIETDPTYPYAPTNADGYTAATVADGHIHIIATLDGYHGDPVDADIAANTDVPVILARNVPPILALHTDGKIFRTADGQPWRWKGVSAFQLLDRYVRGENLAPFLEAYRGYNVLRVWPYVPAKDWGARAWGPPPGNIIRQFVELMGRQGFYVEITLLTDDDPEWLAWAKRIVPEIVQGGCPANLLLEAGNEPTTHKAIDTAALRGVLEASGCLYASGDYEDSARAYGSYGVFHSSRDAEWPRRAHDALEYFGGGGPNSPSDPAHRYPWVADEPAKLQDVGGDRVKDWRAYFGAVSLLGGGGTFHSESGKWAQPPTADEAQLAAAALEGLNAFPADAPLGPYSRPDDASLRTYIVGSFMVRIRPTGAGPSGWTPIDGDGILWRKP